MNIHIHSTDAIKNFNGVDCRVWEGVTEGGVEVYCLIPRIAIKDNESPENIAQFTEELKEVMAPSADASRCFSLRQII
jgi:hypothetical protein